MKRERSEPPHLRSTYSRLRLILAALVVLVGCSGQGWSQEPPDSLAVPFTLTDLDGNERALQDVLGKKLTVLVFWATWGNDSTRALDDLQRLYHTYQDKGLAVVGLCVERQVIAEADRQAIVNTVQSKHVTFPILLDRQLQTFQLYHVVAVPTIFVAGKDRKILHQLSGYPIIGRDALLEFITEQFEGKRPSVMHAHMEHEPDKHALRIYNMARLEFDSGGTESAKQYAAKAQALDTLFVKPLLLLAEIALEAQPFAEAGSYIDRALKLEPRSSDALSLRGLQLAKQGEEGRAIDVLRGVIAHDSTAVLAHCYLGYALGMSGDMEHALEEFARAEALVAREYRIPLLRAAVYERHGKHQEAKTDLARAKQLRKGNK